MSEQVRWLVLEGLVPLFGAGVMFGIWGGGKWLVKPKGVKFTYAWRECFDSMGWLYGGIIIAIQASVRYFNATSPDEVVGGGCIFGAVVCLVVLLNAMNERGQDDKWYPPLSVRIFSIILAVAILAIGYRARGLPQVPEQHHSPSSSQNSEAPVGGKHE